MKGNVVKQTVLKVVGKAAEVEVRRVTSDWKASCVGFLHQPKRPVKK